MNIETKYGIGDEVWSFEYIDGIKTIKSNIVTRVDTRKTEDSYDEDYGLGDMPYLLYDVNDLYPTRELAEQALKEK